MTNKYCEGLDCLICNEKEPCIYKIANKLDEELQEQKSLLDFYQQKVEVLEQECEELNGKLKDTKNALMQASKPSYKMTKINQYYDRYKQALEKIKEYVTTTLRMPLERKIILNIINEVKND